MNEQQWKKLMESARVHAIIYEERSAVRAGKLSPGAARVVGSNWWYYVVCPQDCPCRVGKQIIREEAMK